MNASHFDTLARALAAGRSPRRGALRLLAGGALGLLGWRGLDEAAAHDALKKCKKIKDKKKKKACIKKGKKHNSQHASEAPPPPPPPPTCQPPCTGGKICQSNGTCACPANMSPCAADGSCVATELCCTVEDPSCPAATYSPLECQDGVCVCASGRNAPCGFDGGGWYCCGTEDTCCNGDACCLDTCTVQAGECDCPGGNEPCSLEDSDVTFLYCCADGDTCCNGDCCTTQCTAANSTRGGPSAICGGTTSSCRCSTRIEDDSPICVDYSQGFACPAGCTVDGDCTDGKVCVDNHSCGLPEGQDVMDSCLPPCP